MSVTNPERVVTKQDLADFYEQILPYLGGMPEILANKFSKGDMFSTDERMIGQWIDGKPLYQKNLTKTISSTSGSWTDLETMSGVNIVEFSGYATDGSQNYPAPYNSGSNVYLGFRYESGKIQYITSTSSWMNNNTLYLTIKYTKTTDSAISIGSDTDYSTTEKIVGTWIDGRPIWQKTIQDIIPAFNADKTVSLTDLDIDLYLGQKSVVAAADTTPVLDSYIAEPGTMSGYIARVQVFMSSVNVLYIRNKYEQQAGKTIYITIQYVKATS